MLAELKGDDITIVSALMHGLLNKSVEEKEIRREFGEDILRLLSNIELMTEIKKNVVKHEYENEGLRKVLLAASRDIRALIVKLCDKLANMRELEYLDADERNRICKEVTNVYAPLAYRLGIGRIKAELEDLAFMYLEPDKYKEISGKASDYRISGDRRIHKIKKALEKKFSDEGISAEVSGRVKNIYSIYKKSVDKEEYSGSWHDIIGIRIITKTVEECYTVLRIMHSVFRYVPARFKDYISLPKPNGYQSIHTCIVDEDGAVIEVQIRTMEMHMIAEEGIASHFGYKGVTHSEEFDKKASWVKQLVEEKSNFDVNFFGDEVFVFTPKGKTIELPRGSTSVDFAYSVHTDLGRMCVGAKINGKIKTLNTELENGDIIEIITAKNHTPSIDWLKFVKTSRAREKIKQEIKNRIGVSINAQKKEERIEEATAGLVRVENAQDKKIKLALCCNPVPGDSIEGVIASAKIINIHKRGCDNLNNTKNRCMAYWADPRNEYVEFIINSDDRAGIFAEILNNFVSSGVNIKDAKGKGVNKNLAEFRFGFEPGSLEELTCVISKIKRVKGVKNVYIKVA